MDSLRRFTSQRCPPSLSGGSSVPLGQSAWVRASHSSTCWAPSWTGCGCRSPVPSSRCSASSGSYSSVPRAQAGLRRTGKKTRRGPSWPGSEERGAGRNKSLLLRTKDLGWTQCGWFQMPGSWLVFFFCLCHFSEDPEGERKTARALWNELTKVEVWKPCLILCSLMVLMMGSGGNVVVFYGVNIMRVNICMFFLSQ